MHSEIYADLCEICGTDNVLKNEPMSLHTTFRTGGPADIYVMPDERGLKDIIIYCKRQDIPYMIMGNGSNLLVGDGGIRGVVVEIGSRMSGIDISGNIITAQAGAWLSVIAVRAAEASLSGFEFASGIPGTLGGAIVMNAGAYGGEIKDSLAKVRVLDAQGIEKVITSDQAGLSYRQSAIPDMGYLIIDASLVLKEGDRDVIYENMRSFRDKRVLKQPLEYPSAGSTFKRPDGYYAGKLIEDAGLKGCTVGGAQVSDKHCGFVINKGGATSSDIRALIEKIQETVGDKFGVKLEPEVRFVGEFTDP